MKALSNGQGSPGERTPFERLTEFARRIVAVPRSTITTTAPEKKPRTYQNQSVKRQSPVNGLSSLLSA